MDFSFCYRSSFIIQITRKFIYLMNIIETYKRDFNENEIVQPSFKYMICGEHYNCVINRHNENKVIYIKKQY